MILSNTMKGNAETKKGQPRVRSRDLHQKWKVTKT